MRTRIRIWHKQKDRFETTENLIWPDDNFKLVAMVAFPEQDYDWQANEKAYFLTNAIDKPWWNNEQVTQLFQEEGCRSTSVGDVFEWENGGIWEVAEVGCQQIRETPVERKGLLVSVYRDGKEDCTNGGASSQFDRFVLTSDLEDVLVKGPFTPGWDFPELKLERRPYGSLAAAPVNGFTKGNTGWMFGGNFIYSCDSRFPCSHPIPIYDRQETPGNYAHLTV